MNEFGHFLPELVSQPSRLERIPFIARKKEQRRRERGEDALTRAVIAKLMGDFATQGFTITYGMGRELLSGQVSNMEHVADYYFTQQHQKVRLRSADGKMYKARLSAYQTREDTVIVGNELSIVLSDYFELAGLQRRAVISRNQNFPHYVHPTREDYQGREFFGRLVQDGKRMYDELIRFKEEDYTTFMGELLEASVDAEATKSDFLATEQKLMQEEEAGGERIASVIWNNSSPAGFI